MLKCYYYKVILGVISNIISVIRVCYRTAFNVGRPLIKVVTPRDIAHDLLRNLMIKIILDYL